MMKRILFCTLLALVIHNNALADDASINNGTLRPEIAAMLAGGWSYNIFSRRDGQLPGEKNPYTQIVAQRLESENDEHKSRYAFCVFSLDDNVEGKVQIVWLGTKYGKSRRVSVGNCEHLTGPSRRAIVAKPDADDLIVFFRFIDSD